jgi:hypothetical protein
MSKPQLYIPAHREELTVVDWFVIVGQTLLAFWLAWRGYATESGVHSVAAAGWLFSASNYYTARKRYNPRLH